jgi:hypothetical protein
MIKTHGIIVAAVALNKHTMLVLGRRDLETVNVSVRVHGKRQLRRQTACNVVPDLFAAINVRRT